MHLKALLLTLVLTPLAATIVPAQTPTKPTPPATLRSILLAQLHSTIVRNSGHPFMVKSVT